MNQRSQSAHPPTTWFCLTFLLPEAPFPSSHSASKLISSKPVLAGSLSSTQTSPHLLIFRFLPTIHQMNHNIYIFSFGKLSQGRLLWLVYCFSLKVEVRIGVCHSCSFSGFVPFSVSEGMALQLFCGFFQLPSFMVLGLDVCIHSFHVTFHIDKKSHFLKRFREPGPDQCGSGWLGIILQSERLLVWSWSGHMARLRVWSLVGACMRGNWSMFLSLFSSLPSLLSKNK